MLSWLNRLFKTPKDKVRRRFQAFILEPILTPSGIVDGLDDLPDWDGGGFEAIAPEILEFAPDNLEILPFATPEPPEAFESGYFTVGETGEVEVDFLFDGGKYRGELAIFSLEGMEEYEAGSRDFIQEAARRALSDSEEGYIVIRDRVEGARFSGHLGEDRDWNGGEYWGTKTLQMREGDRFGLMLVANSSVERVFNNPEGKTPLFSLATANPDDMFHVGQIADVTGEGNIFAMEDLESGHSWFDGDYNDLIFRVKGAEVEAIALDEVIVDDWRGEELWGDIVAELEAELKPEPGVFVVGETGEVTVDFLFDGGESEGEVAIFSLAGMEELEVGSEAFIQEAAERAISHSEQGYIAISDTTEGARFVGALNGGDWNEGDYQGIQTYEMNPGDRFGIMLVPEGSVESILDDPRLLEENPPLFSFLPPSEGESIPVVEVEAGSDVFAIEDWHQEEGSESYRNSIFMQISGAESSTPLLEDAIDPDIIWPNNPVERALENHISVIGDDSSEWGENEEISNTLKYAIARAGDLDSYNREDLEETDEWMFYLRSGQDAEGLALLLGAEYEGEGGFIPDTHVFRFSEDVDISQLLIRLAGLAGVEYVQPLVPMHLIPQFSFSDQWHLKNTGQTGGTIGADANVEEAWNLGYTGEGIVVGVVDDGIQFHQDLFFDATFTKFRYRDDLSRILEGKPEADDIVLPWQKLYFETRPNPAATSHNDEPWTPIVVENSTPHSGTLSKVHGTAVAGVIGAAGANGGVRGVAYETDFASLEITSDKITDRQIARGMYERYYNDRIHIYNNSWKPEFSLFSLPNTIAGLQHGIENGRDGLGSIYVFAGGNTGYDWENVNYNPLANSRYTIAVGAIDHNSEQSWYSEPGASLLISTYSSSQYNTNKVGITTTDYPYNGGYDPGNYTRDFGGTSAAAALTSGVIALMLDANPNLTWRDVQHILVKTAEQVDLDDDDWGMNSAGYHINHKYGFGGVDAAAAVSLALEWETIAPEVSVSSAIASPEQVIPDNDNTGISSTIRIEENIKIEWVEVMFDASHEDAGNLEVILISPTGTESVLAESHYEDRKYNNWVFTSARHWGEYSKGNWQLIVRDRVSGKTGIWNEWQLNLYGTENAIPTLTDISLLEGATQNKPYILAYDSLLSASDAKDIDGDEIAFIINSLLSGTLTKDGEAIVPGVTTLERGEELIWTPDISGDRVPAFTVKAFDGKAYSETEVEVAIGVSEPIIPITRIGDEFRVNTYTDNAQAFQSIAALKDGGFLITWQSRGQDGNDTFNQIYAQRYDSNGNPIDNEFRVNTYTGYSDSFPSATALQDGGFLVTWNSNSREGRFIYARRYDDNGNPVGDEFQVSSFPVNHGFPSVTTLKDGGFLITWYPWDSRNQNDINIYARRYDSNGNPVGEEFQVNTSTDNDHFSPSVEALNDGGFLITWQSGFYIYASNGRGVEDFSNMEVYARRYDSNGSPVGDEFQVNTYTDDFQGIPSVVVLEDGDFLIMWTSIGQDGSDSGVYTQRYDSNGNPVGKEFHLNNYTDDVQVVESVVILKDGGFLITWMSGTYYDRDWNFSGIYAQRYDSNSNPIGEEIQLNTYPDRDERSSPVATMLENGEVLIVWESWPSNGSYRDADIFAQRFRVTSV
jgi:subtilisin-like proprotein convertase family protein